MHGRPQIARNSLKSFFKNQKNLLVGPVFPVVLVVVVLLAAIVPVFATAVFDATGAGATFAGGLTADDAATGADDVTLTGAVDPVAADAVEVLPVSLPILRMKINLIDNVFSVKMLTLLFLLRSSRYHFQSLELQVLRAVPEFSRRNRCCAPIFKTFSLCIPRKKKTSEKAVRCRQISYRAVF